MSMKAKKYYLSNGENINLINSMLKLYNTGIKICTAAI